MTDKPANPTEPRWLKALAGADAGEAWKSFLRDYAGVVLSVIRQYQRGPQAMNDLHQRVFTCRFGQQMSLAECLATLRPEFPDLSELRLAAVIAELNSSLDSTQHWRLKVRHQGFVSLDDSNVESQAAFQSPAALGPEQATINEENLARLKAALAQLTPGDRFLLRLRFEQELPLREVARIARLSDPYQARYRIDRAVEQLTGLLAD